MNEIQKKLYRKSEWSKLRDEILKRDNFKCVRCGETDIKKLHIHHLGYLRNTKPWDYPDCYFETLCKKCHSEEHGIIPPQCGWTYIDEDDLGDLIGECEYCHTELRYQHTIFHEKWGYMSVGADCADKLTNTRFASEKEKNRKKKFEKLDRYIKSPKWKHHKNGYFYKWDNKQYVYEIKIWDNTKYFRVDIDVLYYYGNHKLSIPGTKRFNTLDDAKIQAFNAIYSKPRDNNDIEKYITKFYVLNDNNVFVKRNKEDIL